jgi:ZIP family zinc transporter
VRAILDLLRQHAILRGDGDGEIATLARLPLALPSGHRAALHLLGSRGREADARSSTRRCHRDDGLGLGRYTLARTSPAFAGMWVMAGLWGWLAGGALLAGAAVGWLARLPVRLVAAVMAFGSGVLLSALSFDLMDEAQRRGGLLSTAAGFVLGAAIFTAVSHALSKRGAKHRKRSRAQQPREEEQPGSGLAIAVGALLDGIPESIVIGTSMLAGKGVSLVAVGAIFISNLPEGLSSSTGMKRSGRSAAYVFGLWTAIAFLSGLASIVGFVAFRGVPPAVVSIVTAVAAGAILAMLIDTMIPEAFAESHAAAGLLAVVGFLSAFALSKAAAGRDRTCARDAHERAPDACARCEGTREREDRREAWEPPVDARSSLDGQGL